MQDLPPFDNTAYMQAVFIHEIFACLFFIPYIWYLFVLFRAKTFLEMIGKMYFIMPITFFLLSVSLVTGSFVLAMIQFSLDGRILCMIGALFLFLFGEIYRIKRLKKARTSRLGMQQYQRMCKIMYAIFLILFICIVGFIKAHKG